MIIAQQWEPDEGTPQRRWAWLTKTLVDAGHCVEVVTPAPHYPTGRLTSDDPNVQPGAVARGRNGERIWRTKFREHSQLLFSRVLSQGATAYYGILVSSALTKKLNPDVILTTAPPIPAVHTAAIVAGLHRVPLIIDLRDVWPDLLKYMQQWRDSTVRRGLVPFLKDTLFQVAAAAGCASLSFILDRASGIITTAPSFAERLRTEGHPNTISIRNVGIRRNIHLSAHKDDDRKTLRVLYAGTIGRAQGLNNVLRAASRVKDAGVDIELRFVGTGAHAKTLEENARTRELSAEFFGRIPFDEVMEHYRWADTVLVHLEDWKPFEYTVPSKLYEVLEIGRHISASVPGETARIINETRTGSVAKPMDPDDLARTWIELAHNRHMLDVGDRGLQWLQQHGDIDQNAHKFVRFIERIAEKNHEE